MGPRVVATSSATTTNTGARTTNANEATTMSNVRFDQRADTRWRRWIRLMNHADVRYGTGTRPNAHS